MLSFASIEANMPGTALNQSLKLHYNAVGSILGNIYNTIRVRIFLKVINRTRKVQHSVQHSFDRKLLLH